MKIAKRNLRNTLVQIVGLVRAGGLQSVEVDRQPDGSYKVTLEVKVPS